MRPESIDRGKLKLRTGQITDVRPLLDKYGADYFREAGFDKYSPFDIERAAREMTKQIRLGDTPFILAELDGEIVGMVSWSTTHIFTQKPIALLWMIYVMPPHRRTAIGRLLVAFAVDIAKNEGACAFFATIPPVSQAAKSLCNLFRRCGFEPMGGAFTKVL